jgi:hypothetical protein
MVLEVRQRGAHARGRLPAHVNPQGVERRVDDALLASLYPRAAKRRQRGEHLGMRLVEDTLAEPALPGYGEIHRLVTPLLEPTGAPALALVCAYHAG